MQFLISVNFENSVGLVRSYVPNPLQDARVKTAYVYDCKHYPRPHRFYKYSANTDKV
jgi:hypothetical protein